MWCSKFKVQSSKFLILNRYTFNHHTVWRDNARGHTGEGEIAAARCTRNLHHNRKISLFIRYIQDVFQQIEIGGRHLGIGYREFFACAYIHAIALQQLDVIGRLFVQNVLDISIVKLANDVCVLATLFFCLFDKQLF